MTDSGPWHTFDVMRVMKLITCILFLASALHLSADSWAWPETKTIVSNGGNYIAKIVPPEMKSTDSEKRAVATIYKYDKSTDTYKRHREQILLNEVFPVDAIILDDSRIITFDDWHEVFDEIIQTDCKVQSQTLTKELKC